MLRLILHLQNSIKIGKFIRVNSQRGIIGQGNKICRNFVSIRTGSGSRSTAGNEQNKITPLGWFLLLVPASTFGLGCWQVKRKIWKENLIKELEEKTCKEPIPLPENLDEVEKLEYRLIKVKGKFIHDKELYMGPRSFIHPKSPESQTGIFSRRDENIGYLVITPFKLSTREETILVNRGWVPKKALNPVARKNGQIEDEIELVGVVRKGEERPQFTPDHKGNIYLYRDLNKMCAETGADPIFIDANYESTVPDGPIGGQTRVNLRNEHLSYLITWFSLSAITSYMWYKQILRRSPI